LEANYFIWGTLMTVICLTGGIASGKSTAAKFLSAQGAEVIDADKLGHETYAAGSPANAQIIAHFGDDVRAENGEIDRKALGGKVFGNPEALKSLTDIVWPEIRRLAEARIQSSLDRDPARHVVLEAAVLLEAGWEDLGDEVWVVTVDPETAIKRCMARDGFERAAVEQRLAAQLSNEERTAHAHRVFTNDLDEPALLAQLDQAFLAISDGASA
jgi:dephospho-CoA kinase